MHQRRRKPLVAALKLMGATSLIVVAVTAGVAIGRGDTPLDWLSADPDNGTETAREPSAAVSLSKGEDEATSDPASAGSSGSDADTAAEVSSDPEDELVITGEVTVQKEQSEEQAADSESIASPFEAVRLFAERWVESDYSGMYDLLSSDSQDAIARQDFIDRYAGVMQEAGIESLLITMPGGSSMDTQTPIIVEMQSALVGSITQNNSVPTTLENDSWRVNWSPSLIITGLADRCIEYFGRGLPRGSILDVNGEPLAYDGVVNEVGIISGQLENETQTVAALARLLEMRTTDIRSRYQDGQPEWFMPITELPDPLETDVLNAISNMPGVAVRQNTSRIYPLGPAAAHITGYVTPVNAEDLEADESGELVGGQLIGRAGIEAAANGILAGTPGGRLSIVSCATRVEQELIAERPAIDPQDLILSIDSAFQLQVDSALGDVSGSAVIINPQSGAVMAMVSHPTFDPNLFVKGLSNREATEIFDEKKRPLLNRATQQGYPTGSIFKVITMSAAMADLGYEGGSEIYCPTNWSIPGTDQVWRDWTFEYGVGDQGLLNLHTALVNSCNTVFYELGYQLDNEDQNLLPDMTKAFGLGSPTGIAYLQEVPGTVPSPEWKLATLDDYWATGDAVNLSIGQGYLEATPLQMANAYAAIANGGTLLQPYIVQGLQNADGSITTIGERTVIRDLPMSDWMIAELQSALRDQTSNSWGAGSVSVFGDFTWPIAGKTGTAQNKNNLDQKPHSWFAAFGPYGEEADIASIVMVENSGEGVSFAAPTTRLIYLDWLTDA
ncbi:N/A [soil metagenome]